MKHLAVIIPFYQKKSGLLLNAVNSIFFQENIDSINITIIIINDESPIQPDKELLNREPVSHIDIQIIHQKNAGPAKARNVGLDLADSLNVDYIAFLDSDDIWHCDHIHRALRCLEEVSEFYFCDHQRFDEGKSYFFENPYINNFLLTQKKDQSNFFTLESDLFFLHLIETYFCQTSTIVFCHKILNGLRFDETLTVAGEDHLMWLHLVSQCKKITLDVKVGVDYGEGVNIFTSSNHWGTPSSIRNNFDQYRLYHKIKNEFPLSESVNRVVTSKMEEKFSFYSYLSVKFALKFNFLGFKLLFNSDLPKVSVFFDIILTFFSYLISRAVK
tara:strand:- start:2262 stop:3248 length:987 start_codon:yes stop_codon:yes gene_type:complete